MQRIKKLIPKPIKSVIRSHLNRVFRRRQSGTGALAAAPAKPPLHYQRILSASIECAENPINYLNTLTEEIRADPKTIWLAISDLYANSATVLETLQDGAEGISDSYLRSQIFIKKVLRTPHSMSLTAFVNLCEKCGVNNDALKFVKALKTQLASVAISKLPSRDIEAGLENLTLDLDALKHTQKINLIKRKLTSGDDRSADLYKKRFKSSLGEIEKLKISVLENTLSATSSYSYREIEQNFAHIRHQAVIEYNRHLRHLYSRIPEKNNFIDARINPEKREGLKRRILSALIDASPFSFIRVGDGESYGFTDNLFLTEKAYARQELHWWGETLPPHLRQELQSGFRHSLMSANLIGIPTVFRFCNEISSAADKPVTCNSLLARLIAATKNCLESVSDETIYVDEQSNLFLFDLPFLETLLATARRVVVVSGLSETEMRRLPFFRTKDHLQFIELPTHRMLRGHAMGTPIEEILPHCYSRYISFVEQMSAPGVLVLISAGFIGKQFIASAANRGAVALDIGQQLLNLAKETLAHETP